MSDILDRIHAAGDDLIDDKMSGGIDDLLDEAEELAEKHLPADLVKSAAYAASMLKDPRVKGAAENLTKLGLARVAGLFEDDKVQEARRAYIMIEATTAERIAFQQQSGDAAVLLHAKRAAEWDALVEAFERIGKIALRALGKLALGMIGL